MGIQNGQLPIPGMAIADSGSVELIRVWIAGKGLQTSLRVGAWGHTPTIDEPKAWGIVLADVVNHVADALTRQGKNKSETVVKIRASFLAELDGPTSSTVGEFVDEPSRN